ncbi:hypothetical protein, partial [Fictibacillus aquaticus]
PVRVGRGRARIEDNRNWLSSFLCFITMIWELKSRNKVEDNQKPVIFFLVLGEEAIFLVSYSRRNTL